MPPVFYAATSSIRPLAVQQVRVSTIAEQPSSETVLSKAVTTIPVKDVTFHQAIVSQAVFNLNKDGPVVSPGAVAFYNDRFDTNKKWYLPEFRFPPPLQNCFLFTCWISGLDSKYNHTYSGEVTFTLQKNTPADVTVSEIPLNHLSFVFTVFFADNSFVGFPCSFVQDGNNFKLTIRLDQQDGLINFYKAISDRVNAKYCFIKITASYFGYTQKPAPTVYWQALPRSDARIFRSQDSGDLVAGRMPETRFILPARTTSAANDTTEYITNDAMPFSRDIVNVNFDCHDFPSNYLIKAADNSTEIFACKPPFGDASLAKNEYTKLHVINGSLAEPDTGVSAVYINVYNGNYLAIPNTYNIALDETDGNTLIPAAYLFTKIDANNISNSVATFKFTIAPAISGFQLLLLKKVLLQNTPVSLNKTLDDIIVEFPAYIHQPELIQFNKDEIPNIEIAMMGAYAHGVRGSNLFGLEFQNVNIGNGNAALIASRLKQTQGKMIENIVFAVDSDTDANPQASIVLSLEDITGKGLDIRQDAVNNVVYLINKTLLTISASKLADKNDEPKNLEPPVAINANQAVSTNAITDVTEIPFTEFQYKYGVQPNYRDKILNEIRTDAGQEVKDDVIVTNNTGLFALYGIDHIDLTLAIVNPDEPDPAKAVLKSTNVISLGTDGAVTFIDFVLPVVSYLSKWSVAYSTVIHFTDSRVQQNGPQHIEDINSVGKVINLTVSNLNLRKA
jgi:hypothetical protein